MDITEKLFTMQDEGYKLFSAKLIPNVDIQEMIGIRTPVLRKFAAGIKNSESAKQFMQCLPHKYLKENHLHGMLICFEPNFNACIALLDQFLPYVDNWGTCDLLRPASFKKNLDKLHYYCKKWIQSDHVYTIRFGIEMLMMHYLDQHFDREYFDLVSSVKNDDYYVKMMVAWYFATALAKQYETAVTVLQNEGLDKWTHNKTIQKAVESYRISDEQKRYLKTLKRK